MARFNRCPVPACKVGATAGWFGGARLTGLSGFLRTTGFQVSSGSEGGAARGAVTPGTPVTVSAYVRTSFTGTLSARINWYRAGAYLSQQASNTGFAVTSGAVRRINITATPPSGADQALLLFPTRTGTVVVTCVLIENGTALGSYFDGDTSPGGSWDGTDGASTSTLQNSQPPTVAAGADVTTPQGTPVTITATDNGNGSTITARSWTIVSGPVGAGTTIGTAATLTWEPETFGTFVLRYTATSAAGTGSDDVTVTATEVVHPLRAPTALAARLPGRKIAARNLRAATALTARLTAGRKTASRNLRAPLTITARLSGARNPLRAQLTLAAGLTPAGTTRTGRYRAAPLAPTGAVTGGRTDRTGNLTGGVLALTGRLFGRRIVAAVRQVPARPSLARTYQLVVVARIPQALGPPRLEEVEAIDWSGLSYTDELNKAQTLNAGCDVESLPPEIRQRLINWKDLPSEVWLYRQGRKVFAGPLLGAQVQGTSLSFIARGLLAYLDFMMVDRDLVFPQTDQTVIAAGLVDQWQALEYGHFGIDTTGIPSSGVLRDATYLRKELHRVGKRVIELGGRVNGFDVSVDPSSRQLLCAYPYAGVDRSSGEESVVFDRSNITSPNITLSGAPDDIASEVYGTGTSSDAPTVFNVASNQELRARFGRVATSATFDGVKEQSTLDGHLAAVRDARSDVVRIPGPDTRVTADSDLARYDVGDWVSYALHEVLAVEGSYRLLKRQVSAQKKTGQEAVSLAFV